MLLRRFVGNLKKQEWAAIVVELVIVIGGVFFGIQAANWNADRLEQEEVRLVSERLIADLQKDLSSREVLVRYHEAVFESAERTVQWLNAESVNDPSAFVIDAYRSTEYVYRPPTRAAFDEIISSGRLGLIPADARQAGFIDYFRYDNSLAMREAVRASPYRHRVRRLITYDIQVAIRARCSDLLNERYEIIGFNENCDLTIPTGRLEYVANALRSDPELLGDLRLHFSILNATMPNFRGEIVNLKATIKALEAAR